MQVVCYSGGHSSALVAIEVVRRFGKTDVVLLNHDINPRVEDSDIKRFKQEVADYLGLPITYANIGDIRDPEKIPDQFDVCLAEKAFQAQPGKQFCTSRLKTKPFEKWVHINAPQGSIVYYGFDANEIHRVIRRRKILEVIGYRMCAPLAEWPRKERTIRSTLEIGIDPPGTYSTFIHANCVGCLKASKQHWYIVYCTRPDVWVKAKETECIIQHSILKEGFLESFESLFEEMKTAGVIPSEKVKPQEFWREARKRIQSHRSGQMNFLLMGELGVDEMPCECVF